MKILQVIPVFNPPELYGGSQQSVYQTSKELVKRGHEVTIYASDARRSDLKNRVIDEVEEIDGIKILHFRNVSPYLSKMGLIITPGIKNMLKGQGNTFDLIHVHEVRGYQHLVVWKYANKFGTPYVIQAHGNLEAQVGLFRKFYDYFYLPKILADARVCIALNRREVEQYRRLGVDPNKIVVLPNGIDLVEYSSLPAKGSFKKKIGMMDSEKILLYLGRIHEAKGLDILVKAFANVAKKFDEVKVVIAGVDDGYIGKLKALIKALKMESKILILGPLYGRNKLEAYVDAEAYVLPSRYEAFSITILEAYACGKPVIASACEGPRELVVNGKTGILVEPGNVTELSEAITYLLSRDKTEMGFIAREFVKQFSIRKTVDKLEQLYCNIVFSS